MQVQQALDRIGPEIAAAVGVKERLLSSKEMQDQRSGEARVPALFEPWVQAVHKFEINALPWTMKGEI